MTLQQWTCAACHQTYETYIAPSRRLKERVCGRCHATGRRMVSVHVAQREARVEKKLRDERWEERRRQLLGIA